jgi:transporter family-2 protein
MAGVLWSLLGVLAGAFIAVQAPVNSQLAKTLGLPVAAAAMREISVGRLAGAALLLAGALMIRLY